MKITRRINRARPIGPPQAYQTYSVRTPLQTHYRKAVCSEVDCAAYRDGWTFKVQDLDEQLWHAIKTATPYRKYRRVDLTEKEGYLIFEPGQLCFNAHKHLLTLDRPEIYVVGKGDWRSFNPRKAQVFKRPEHWVEHMHGHLDLINQLNQRG